MTTKPEKIDTSAGRVHKSPIVELIREAAESLDVLTSSMALPERVVEERKADAKRIVAELYDTADEIKRQEPVAYAVFPDNGDIRIWCPVPVQAETLRQQYGDQLKYLYAAPQPAEQKPDVSKLVEALERVRLTDQEAKHSGPIGSAHWNNAATACIEAVRASYRQGGEV